MSVSSMLASQGSAVVRISTRLIARQPQRLRHAEHAQRQLQDPQRRQRLDPEIDPEVRILAEMQIEAEHGRAAGDQIAFIPPRQIAAGIPLEQRIAVPQRRREQHQRNGDGRDPDQAAHRRGRARKICVVMLTFPRFQASMPGMAGRPKFTNSRTLIRLDFLKLPTTLNLTPSEDRPFQACEFTLAEAGPGQHDPPAVL